MHHFVVDVGLVTKFIQERVNVSKIQLTEHLLSFSKFCVEYCLFLKNPTYFLLCVCLDSAPVVVVVNAHWCHIVMSSDFHSHINWNEQVFKLGFSDLSIRKRIDDTIAYINRELKLVFMEKSLEVRTGNRTHPHNVDHFECH